MPWIVQCAYKGCGLKQTKDTNMSFHKFPSKNIERCQEWVRRCGWGKNWSSKSRKICAKHFMDCDFVGGERKKFVRLEKDALPLDYHAIGNANSPSSSHSQGSNNCSTLENSTTPSKSFQENRREKIQRREKTIERNESLNSQKTSSSVPEQPEKFQRDQMNVSPGIQFSQEESNEQQEASTSCSRVDEDFSLQDENHSMRRYKKPDGKEIMERLKTLIEKATRKLNLEVQNSNSYTNREVYQFVKRIKEKISVLSRENSEIQRRLETIEHKSEKFSEILENHEAELMRMKSLVKVPIFSDGIQRDSVGDLQKKIKLITHQRDLYRQQLDENENEKDMFQTSGSFLSID